MGDRDMGDRDIADDVADVLAAEAEDTEAGKDVDAEYVPNRQGVVVPDWRTIAIARGEQLDRTRHNAETMTLTIAKLRREVWTLNKVIERRKRTATRQRTFIDAVRELHRPVDGTDLGNTTCRNDGHKWPCSTHLAIQTVAMERLRAFREAFRRAEAGDSE